MRSLPWVVLLLVGITVLLSCKQEETTAKSFELAVWVTNAKQLEVLDTVLKGFSQQYKQYPDIILSSGQGMDIIKTRMTSDDQADLFRLLIV